MREEHFLVTPVSQWTLTSQLGRMLFDAETRYGPRDKEWTVLGIELVSEEMPHIWYPANFGKTITIRLGSGAHDCELIACYQLAHEAIHLLAPTGKGGASVLEEGLA